MFDCGEEAGGGGERVGEGPMKADGRYFEVLVIGRAVERCRELLRVVQMPVNSIIDILDLRLVHQTLMGN